MSRPRRRPRSSSAHRPTAKPTLPLGTNIRIQFSRDIDPATLKGRLQGDRTRTARLGAGAPVIDFTTEYRGAARVLEVKFAKPLERFRTVRVTFDEGVIGTDQQPLQPWTLTFTLTGCDGALNAPAGTPAAAGLQSPLAAGR